MTKLFLLESYFDKLPDEILAEVLSYLHYTERYRLITVSERFMRCMYLKCKSIKIEVDPDSPEMFHPSGLSADEKRKVWLYICQNEYKHAISIEIEMNRANLRKLSQTLQFAPIVKHLRLSAPRCFVDSYGVEGPLQALNFLNLRSLSLNFILKFYKTTELNDWFSLYGSILHELGIAFHNNREDLKEEFLNIIVNCRNITQLTIMSNVNIGFMKSLAKNMSQLKRLTIRRAPSLITAPIVFYTSHFPSLEFVLVECDESGHFLDKMPILEENLMRMQTFGDLTEEFFIGKGAKFFIYSPQHQSVIISHMGWFSMKLPVNVKHVIWTTYSFLTEITEIDLTKSLFENNSIESLRLRKPINSATDYFGEMARANPNTNYLYSQISSETNERYNNLITNFLNPYVVNSMEYLWLVNHLNLEQETYSEKFHLYFANALYRI